MFEGVVEELVTLPDRVLCEHIETLELRRRATEAELAAAISVATARGIYAVDGHRSMTGFLRASLNWSSAEANRFLGFARAVDRVAGFGNAWFSGRFGTPQAVVFSRTHGKPRVGERLAEFAPQLLEHAEQLPYSDFAAAVDHFIDLADADGAHDDRDGNVEARTAAVLDVGSSLHVSAAGGDALTAAEMIAIHDRFCDLEYRHDVEARRVDYGDDADR